MPFDRANIEVSLFTAMQQQSFLPTLYAPIRATWLPFIFGNVTTLPFEDKFTISIESKAFIPVSPVTNTFHVWSSEQTTDEPSENTNS